MKHEAVEVSSEQFVECRSITLGWTRCRQPDFLRQLIWKSLHFLGVSSSRFVLVAWWRSLKWKAEVQKPKKLVFSCVDTRVAQPISVTSGNFTETKLNFLKIHKRFSSTKLSRWKNQGSGKILSWKFRIRAIDSREQLCSSGRKKLEKCQNRNNACESFVNFFSEIKGDSIDEVRGAAANVVNETFQPTNDAGNCKARQLLLQLRKTISLAVLNLGEALLFETKRGRPWGRDLTFLRNWPCTPVMLEHFLIQS